MTSQEFLKLGKEKKQTFVARTLTKKKSKPDGKYYFIQETACCQNFVEWKWGTAPEKCPHCNVIYWQKPALEYLLFTEQDKFLKQYPDTTILGEVMFPLIVDYAKNLMQGMIKNKVTYEKDFLDEKANDAATQLVEVILRDTNHCMRISFGGYLKRLCKSVLYKGKENDANYSLNQLLDENKKDGAELGDRLVLKTSKDGITEEVEDSVSTSVEMEQVDIVSAADKAVQVVEKSSNAIFSNTGDQKDCILFLLGMNVRFSHRDDKPILDFYGATSDTARKFVETGELVVFNYLKNISS